MKFLTSKKYKQWSFNVCAIIVIICAILKFVFHFKDADIVLYSALALFFISNAFEKVEKESSVNVGMVNTAL